MPDPRRPLAVLALLLLAACGKDPDDDTATPAACGATGPAVERLEVATGYRVIDAPVSAPWVDEGRTVPVGIWYPTADDAGETAKFLDFFKDELSWVDAGYADPAPDCLLPLVVYSHGSQGWGGNASPLLRHLVAQGWIAAAPDHIDNTLSDNIDPKPVSYPMTRVADISATIDALAALPADDPLAGRIDTSRVLVMGHSYGGQTAWLFSGPEFDQSAIEDRCDESELGCTDADRAAFAAPVDDERVVGALPMDGFADTNLVAAEGWEAARLPILYLARSGDGDDGPFTTAAAADVTWARFEGACHETFTSTPLPCDFDQEEGLADVPADLAAAAAARVLERDDAVYAEILDGTTVVDERVTVQRTRE